MSLTEAQKQARRDASKRFREAHKDYNKRYRETHRAEAREFQQRRRIGLGAEVIQAEHLLWRKNHQFKYTTNACRRRAKEKGLPFDITADYLEEIWTGICPVFNTSIIHGHGLGLGALGASCDLASLDRIISEQGYVRGNVRWLSHKANLSKNNLTSEQLHQFANWIKANV